MEATEEIKGLNVFADWRIIASHSRNVAWQGSPAIGSIRRRISTGEVSAWHHGVPSAMLHSVLVPHDPAPVQLASVDSEKLLEGKWLILLRLEQDCVLVCRTRLLSLPATGE